MNFAQTFFSRQFLWEIVRIITVGTVSLLFYLQLVPLPVLLAVMLFQTWMPIFINDNPSLINSFSLMRGFSRTDKSMLPVSAERSILASRSQKPASWTQRCLTRRSYSVSRLLASRLPTSRFRNHR